MHADFSTSQKDSGVPLVLIAIVVLTIVGVGAYVMMGKQ